MVGMPLCAEQPDNIMRAQDRGYALAVSVKKLDTLAKDLEGALKRILQDPGFGKSAARVSHIVKAHRQAPVEVAAGQAKHLYSNALMCDHARQGHCHCIDNTSWNRALHADCSCTLKQWPFNFQTIVSLINVGRHQATPLC